MNRDGRRTLNTIVRAHDGQPQLLGGFHQNAYKTRLHTNTEARKLTGKHHDLVDLAKRYKAELHGFYMDLKQWRRFKTRRSLNWQKVRFGEDQHAAIPKERGIYIFTVELSPSKLPSHGYIMYVGITGDDSDANLYKRYAQYLRHLKNQDGRPAVFYMLENWAEDLFFNFVSIPNTGVDLSALEKAIINAVIPPVNKRDFDAHVAAPKAATF